MKPLLPDTNVLVYETVEDSPNHEKASEIFDSARSIILPSIVLHEYLWVMIKRLQVPLDFMIGKIDEYFSDRRIRYVAEPPDAVLDSLELLKTGSVRNLNDYLILSTAVRYDAVLATFDGELVRMAENLGVEVVPR
ncbi:MAG: PIN domain-containing protein [Candidatus Korarchaeota archaeon]|nr:PIN domain-containing protein [Candidatus Korarchaeota archaeon]